MLKDKVAIITGGAGGIGYAIAERYLQEGAKVVIADIDTEKGEKAASTLAQSGDTHFVHCNVAEKLDVHNLVASALDLFGQIDILVNNAGILIGADFLKLSEKDFDRVMGVNLKGAFLCSQAVARHMVERADAGNTPGCIINMSSINAVVSIPDQIAYCVSKGGINQLTTVTAQALAPHGIRVNAIGPGSVMTNMLESVFDTTPDKRKSMLSRTPLGRAAEPAEIAAVAAFLASNDASYITGQTIYTDGGRLGQNYTVAVKG